jgi:hypothetical protein
VEDLRQVILFGTIAEVNFIANKKPCLRMNEEQG